MSRHSSRGRAWRSLRWEIIDRQRGRCAEGGCPDAALEVHHVTPRELGGADAPENLVAYCRAHHAAAHGKRPPRRRDPGWARLVREARGDVPAR